MTRPPVLMLDIDGVLAPLDRRQPGLTYRALDTSGWNGAVTVAVEVIDALRDLIVRNVVAARWLTSWEDEAVTCFAPAVGLPRLPVYRAADVAGTGWWKLRVVERFMAATSQRPVLWVDDEIAVHGGFAASRYAGRVSLIETDPLVGLTLEHLARIEEWAVSHQPA